MPHPIALGKQTQEGCIKHSGMVTIYSCGKACNLTIRKSLEFCSLVWSQLHWNIKSNPNNKSQFFRPQRAAMYTVLDYLPLVVLLTAPGQCSLSRVRWSMHYELHKQLEQALVDDPVNLYQLKETFSPSNPHVVTVSARVNYTLICRTNCYFCNSQFLTRRLFWSCYTFP